MKDEIKEILELLNSTNDNIMWCDEITLNVEQSHLLLDYITNLQEQLHQASLDIQELTEKDIGCPSWCDKLTNLQKENEILKELNVCVGCNNNPNYKLRNEKAIEILKLCNSKCSKEVINILNGDDKYE